MSALGVEVGKDRIEEMGAAGFAALESEWNALAEEAGDSYFLRHEFLGAWIRRFAGDRARILAWRDSAGRLQAALPLVARRETLYGFPAAVLASAANDHSCRFDLLSRRPEEAADLFWKYLVGRPGWDFLRLDEIPAGGAAWELYRIARRHRYPVGVYSSQDSPYLNLPPRIETLLEALDSKFRSNLRRRWKKLRESGSVQVEWVRGGPDLEIRLREGLELERAGWKGREGTAILQHAPTTEFYRDLAHAAAPQDRLRLGILRRDGRAVAFQFAIAHAGKYLLLKTAYDEGLGSCSPGQLLLQASLEECVAQGLEEFDFLGPDMPWKRDWSPRHRHHDKLFIFRKSPLWRTLADAKFRALPALRRRIDSWKR